MKTANSESDKKRIQELEAQIEELKKRWPAHSVPPMLMQELDELEEELAKVMERASQGKGNA